MPGETRSKKNDAGLARDAVGFGLQPAALLALVIIAAALIAAEWAFRRWTGRCIAT
jgi:hypothetical protein